MFCKHCGSQIDETAKFCTTCGKIVEREEYAANQNAAPDYFDTPAPNYYNNPAPNYFDTPTPNYNGEGYRPQQRESGGGILALAILSLVFAETFFLSFVGLIFGYIAKSKINSYIIRNGELDAPGKVGRGLSTAGIIVSWIMTGLFVLYIIALLALL